ncbi:hypothetical protein [Mesorhizobium sp. WSM2239]|uniref:DUF5666 domain-containing protein n=2 Tax=unclassified Mesorhizobium TaxID=325217 RepID=A0AAU8D756_9HYPH
MVDGMRARWIALLLLGVAAAGAADLQAAERLRVPQIQDSGHTSPHVRSPVIFEGVVTYIFGNNFIVREIGDGNDANSDSIIVRRKADGFAVGDRVRVEGAVRESDERDETRTTTVIADAVFEKLPSGAPLAPVAIGTGGRMPPTEVLYISEDSGDPSISGTDFYESLESTPLSESTTRLSSAQRMSSASSGWWLNAVSAQLG